MELQDLKGVGPKILELLNKLNIFTIEDLISYYPYRYNVYKPIDLHDCEGDISVAINATIETTPKIAYIKRNFNRLSFKALTSNLLINVTIFNRAFLYKHLDVGKEITIIGKYDRMKNTFVANDIKLGFLNQVKIEPVYHVIKGLKKSNLRVYIQESLKNRIKEKI